MGVPIIRTIVFWGLYWGPPILGNYHLGLSAIPILWVWGLGGAWVHVGDPHHAEQRKLVLRPSLHEHVGPSSYLDFPKLRIPFWRVPIIRTIES